MTPDIAKLLPILVPLILLELALVAYALWDLAHRAKVKGGNKWVWVAVIVAIQWIGPLVYLFLGREEE